MMSLTPRSYARCKKILVVIAIAFLVFHIAAPSSLSAEKVTVLYSNATFTGTALFVAKDAGLCKQIFAKKALARWTRSTDSSLLDYTYESWRADYGPLSPKVESRELDLLLESAPKGISGKDVSSLLDMRYLP